MFNSFQFNRSGYNSTIAKIIQFAGNVVARRLVLDQSPHKLVLDSGQRARIVFD